MITEPNQVENEEGWPPWLQTWVMPFVQDSGLYPVLFAILGHMVVVLVPLILALGRGVVLAAVPLTPLLMVSFWFCKTEAQVYGVGRVSAAVIGTWTTAIILAILAGMTNVL